MYVGIFDLVCVCVCAMSKGIFCASIHVCMYFCVCGCARVYVGERAHCNSTHG